MRPLSYSAYRPQPGVRVVAEAVVEAAVRGPLNHRTNLLRRRGSPALHPSLRPRRRKALGKLGRAPTKRESKLRRKAPLLVRLMRAAQKVVDHPKVESRNRNDVRPRRASCVPESRDTGDGQRGRIVAISQYCFSVRCTRSRCDHRCRSRRSPCPVSWSRRPSPPTATGTTPGPDRRTVRGIPRS